MHALIVVSHPLTHSLTHSVAQAVAQGITLARQQDSVEFADLTREGFNPVFSAADAAAFAKSAPLPDDVIAEQARIEKADALVLVFPIYWWTMPGLLKGWIDRVFANGWAYEEAYNCQYRSNSDPPCQSKTDPPPLNYSSVVAFVFFWSWPLFSLSFSR